MKLRILFPAALLAAGCAASGGKGREVQVAVTDDGFVPKIVTVAKGEPATLVITRKVEATCVTEAVFANGGRKYDLPLNQPVRIPLATASADTLRFACGEDMYHGEVIVR